jgi:hypothetical protein
MAANDSERIRDAVKQQTDPARQHEDAAQCQTSARAWSPEMGEAVSPLSFHEAVETQDPAIMWSTPSSTSPPAWGARC